MCIKYKLIQFSKVENIKIVVYAIDHYLHVIPKNRKFGKLSKLYALSSSMRTSHYIKRSQRVVTEAFSTAVFPFNKMLLRGY